MARDVVLYHHRVHRRLHRRHARRRGMARRRRGRGLRLRRRSWPRSTRSSRAAAPTLETMSLTDTDPYAGKANYVFTSRHDLPVFGEPTFVHDDAVPFVRALKLEAGGAIWLIGGGRTRVCARGCRAWSTRSICSSSPSFSATASRCGARRSTQQAYRLVEARAWPGDLAEVRYRLRSARDSRRDASATSDIRQSEHLLAVAQ